MKKVLSYLFFLSILLLGANAAFAKKLPVLGENYTYYSDLEKHIASEEYRVFEDYMQEYYNSLYEKFQPKKNFSKYSLLFAEIHIWVNKDGSLEKYFISRTSIDYAEYIKDPLRRHNSQKQAKEFVEYIENIVLNTTPKPFPKEFEHEQFIIDITFGYAPLNPIAMNRVKDELKIHFIHGEMPGANGYIVPPIWDLRIYKK